MNIPKNATLHRAEHFPKEDQERLQQIHNQYYRKVAELFCRFKHHELSPTRVHQHFYPGFPRTREGREHTSTRRAITDLTTEGYLVKTETVIDSLLGGKEHCWKWVNTETADSIEDAERRIKNNQLKLV